MSSPFDNEEEREHYARYGRVLYAIQVLEYEMVNTYAVLALLPQRNGFEEDPAWQAHVDDFLDTGLTHTFGTMLKKLKGTGRLSGDLLTELEACKVERDFFAHRFFRHYTETYPTRASAEADMLARCDVAFDRFLALNHSLEEFSHGLAEAHGLTRDMIEADIEDDHQRRYGAD